MEPAQLVHELVADFIAEVTELAKQAVLDDAATALSAPAGEDDAPDAADEAAPRRKRDRAAMSDLQDRIVRVVQDNPGRRVEELSNVLGAPSKELAAPIKKLIAAGQLRTEGQRRGTRYFPAAPAAEPAPAAAPEPAAEPAPVDAPAA